MKALVKSVLPWSVPAVALLMLAVVLLPAEVWRQAEHGAVYDGFDSNLIYVRSRSPNAPGEGIVQVSEESLRLTALPASQPTVHLLTTPLSFRASMMVRILERREGTIPFRIGIWSPRSGAGYHVNFGPPPQNLVTMQVLAGDGVVVQRTLGTYTVGQDYRLKLALDRDAGTIGTELSSAEVLPAEGNALKLDGGPSDPAYGDVASDYLPIVAGRSYAFGGRIRLLSGSDASKLSLQWYDAQGRYLGFSHAWQGVAKLDGDDWTEMQLQAIAPPGAAAAQFLLGSGNGTVLLFRDLFLRESGALGTNLLPNGEFQDGLAGWRVERGGRSPEVISLSLADVASSVTAVEAPQLFEASRLSMTVSAFSPAGIASSQVKDYRLTLPARLYMAVKIEDALASSLVSALLALGALLCLWKVVGWLLIARRREASSGESRLSRWLSRPVAIHSWPLLLGLGGAVLVYLLLNGLLFNVGTHPFDMTSQKVWSYIAARSGVLDVYAQASVVSLAKVWNGGPFHEAVFPYLPVMAYYFAGVGWLYRLFLTGPQGLVLESFSLEFLIKAGNVLLGLADAMLIYLILRQLRLRRPVAFLAGGLFLFNPALWVSMSLWGETETISLFFVLLSVWLAERGSPVGAWLTLGAAALTRPQMAVPVLLLGVVYSRKFSLKQNIPAISWSIILLFLVLGPFALGLSPSLPVDYVTRVYATQLGGGEEPALQTVTNSGYSLWPLVTLFLEGQAGVARNFVPEATLLVVDLDYGEASSLLMAAVLVAVSAALLLRPQYAQSARGYLPLLALGMFGWSMVVTGMISRYFLYSLAFVIVSRASLSRPAYFFIVFMLTATTLVSTYGALGFAVSEAPSLAPALDNAVTRFFMDLYSADWFVVVGVLSNAVALSWLAREAVRPLWPRPAVSSSKARVEWHGLAQRETGAS